MREGAGSLPLRCLRCVLFFSRMPSLLSQCPVFSHSFASSVRNRILAGPIIDQDVAHITHRDSVANMIRRAEDGEKKRGANLAGACRRHLHR